MKTASFFGRMVFGGFFLYNGVMHFVARKDMAKQAASKGVPYANLAVAATGAALVAGGTSIILGLKPNLGTGAITGFLATVSPIMHNFWRYRGPKRETEMHQFTKNLALLGGAMALMGTGDSWPAKISA